MIMMNQTQTHGHRRERQEDRQQENGWESWTETVWWSYAQLQFCGVVELFCVTPAMTLHMDSSCKSKDFF